MIASEGPNALLGTIGVLLSMAVVASLSWVMVQIPIVGAALVGSFVGGFFGFVIGGYESPDGMPTGLLVGASIGLGVGCLFGCLVAWRQSPRSWGDPWSAWFCLAGLLGAGIVAWVDGPLADLPQLPQFIVRVTVTLVFAVGLALRSRHRTAGLALLLGLDGIALGMMFAALMFATPWGIATGAAIGAMVGIADAVLVGRRYAGHSSDAVRRTHSTLGRSLADAGDR